MKEKVLDYVVQVSPTCIAFTIYIFLVFVLENNYGA